MLPKDVGIPERIVESYNAACRLFVHVMDCPEASDETIAEAASLFDAARDDYDHYSSIRSTAN